MDISSLISDKVRSIPTPKMAAFFNLPPDVISLGLGEPGFSTSSATGQGAIEAIRSGRTFYPPSNGYVELKEKISEYLAGRFNIFYSKDEVLLTPGSSLGLDDTIRAFVSDGDEVLLPKPAYGFYATLVRLSGGVPVFVPTYEQNGWALDAADVAAAITPRTKLLILNYPNNPTGSVMSDAQFAKIADVIRDKDIIVISDEVYAEFVYNGRHCTILHQPGMRERTVFISGFSKSMAMTGWRLGYLCAPEELLAPIAMINAATVMCAPGVAQAAALRGLEEGRGEIEMMAKEYRARRDYICERAHRLGWRCSPPNGAFYLWADVSPSGWTAEELVHTLIRECKVALMPGTIFGDDYTNFVRITYSYDMETIKEAMNRIEAFLSRRSEIPREA